MASATPGGAPGYDYDKEFGNNITHLAARTSQRLRGYTVQSPEVKGRTPFTRFRECKPVPGVRREGILCAKACEEAHGPSQAGDQSDIRGRRLANPYRKRASSHSL